MLSSTWIFVINLHPWGVPLCVQRPAKAMTFHPGIMHVLQYQHDVDVHFLFCFVHLHQHAQPRIAGTGHLVSLTKCSMSLKYIWSDLCLSDTCVAVPLSSLNKREYWRHHIFRYCAVVLYKRPSLIKELRDVFSSISVMCLYPLQVVPVPGWQPGRTLGMV